MQWGNKYVYARSDGGAVWIAKSDTLEGIGSAAQVKIWDPPNGQPYSQDVWAPELHYLDGKWYVYVAADDGDNATHRMYVLEGNSQDPSGSYTFKGKIAATTDRWAIDGTVLDYNGSRYFIWSGWPGFTDGQQNLYIAPMSNPWTISGDRVLISQPNFSWEQHGLPINEGPEVLQHDGKTFVIYSASGFWTNQYALGQLQFTGTDPLAGSTWIKSSVPVFSQGNGVVGVGHASFVTSPDGSEDWIVYHAHTSATNWDGVRNIHIQPFTFNANGSPNFGQPTSSSTPLALPSGTPTFYFSTQSAFGASLQLQIPPTFQIAIPIGIQHRPDSADDVLALLDPAA